MSILEDLWFDNLVVQDAEIRKGSEQEKALAASVRCDDALRETLTEKQKEQAVFPGPADPVSARRKIPSPKIRGPVKETA